MEFVEIGVTEEELKTLEKYGTRWSRTGRDIVAIEIRDGVTLNFIFVSP